MTKPVVFRTGLGFVEGPAWSARSELSVVSISHGCVYTLDRGGEIVGKVPTGGGPNGLALSGDAMYVAQNGGIFGASGKSVPCIQKIGPGAVERLFAGVLEAPNDICFGPDGRLYVTDPVTDKALFEPIEGRVLVCDLRSGKSDVVIEGRYFPNGLAFDESGLHLYLTHTYSRLVECFSFQKAVLKSEGTLCEIAGGRPDGLAIDAAGNLWVCTPGTGGLEVFTRSGQPVRRIEFGEGTMTTNCCFGGRDLKTLFVTAAGIGTIFALPVDVPGLSLRRG